MEKKSIRVELDAEELAEFKAACTRHGLTLSDATRRSLRAFFYALDLAAEPPTPRGAATHKTKNGGTAAKPRS